MKLLTVTVPCYNSEAYMEACIDSLLVGGDRVEIIIIDDGSTDRTGAIADEYAARYPNIVRVIHQENGGHGEGINQGLKHATGTYFKVVDSDDTLSADFPKVLDKLEQCERQGGVDLLMTNYYYVHTDGIGDRAINYSNVFKNLEGQIVTWSQTRKFKMHQLITLHSGTFRTEHMRKWADPLPKHVFYEDNLMVYQTLPHVQKLCYVNYDLYRYAIGRPDQSVQEAQTRKRYMHQVQVSQAAFQSCHLDSITDKKQKRYMKHELFMLLAFAIEFARLNKNKESDRNMQKMWKDCIAFDPKWGRHFRYRSLLFFICIPGPIGRWFTNVAYRFANKIVRFN